MRKVLLIAALAATAILLDSGMASACGRRCGGGRRGCGGGGCHVGRCGRGHHHGCATCGGGCYVGGGCASGICAVTGTADAGLSATVVVQLPADATLTIDGEVTTSTSATRLFQTPDLEPGQTFHYTFTAQVERDGKVQSVSRLVEVRAGETSQLSMTPPTAVVAAR